MKAVVATGYGAPDVLQLQEVEKPTPAADEVLVKVMASAATQAEAMMRTGRPYYNRLFLGFSKPKHDIPGTCFAGVIEAVGENVHRFQVGDRVFGVTALGFGTNAEYVAVSIQDVILPMPENMGFAEAAPYCDGHLTSYNFLTEVANLQPGQKVLINGASGALGTAAVQIARYLGAEVTAVCSGKNEGLVRSLGAHHTIDYTKEDFTRSSERYDVVFDTIGKSSFGQAKRVLTETGQYLSPVLKIAHLLKVLWTSLFGTQKARFDATGLKDPGKLREMLSAVTNIYRAGKLTTVIDRQFPLEKLAEAHRYIDTGRKKGNVVMVSA